MSRRSLPILLVLLAVIATGVVWIAGRIGDSGPVVGESPQTAARGRENDDSRASADPQLTEAARESAPRVATVESDPSSPPRVIATTPGFDPELVTAIWVEGHVVIPRGTPADEHVEVVAEGAPFESRNFHRVAVGPDGSFRVAFARGSGLGVLRLEARYLYLKSYSAITLPTADPDIVLRPVLGGCIRGRVLLPLAGAPPRSSVVGSVVTASTEETQVLSASKQTSLATTAIDEELQFELRGVAAAEACSLTLQCSEVSLPDPVYVQVEPGRILTVDLPVETNAKIAGIVLDSEGQPAPGSTVRYRRLEPGSKPAWFDPPRTTVYASTAGRFELPGLTPGAYRLWAEARYAVNSPATSLDLAPGQTESNLVLRLSRGGRIVGRVLDSEGQPDSGAEVHASTSEGQGTERGTTDYQGRFEISKLVPGEYELRLGHRRGSSRGRGGTLEISDRKSVVHVEDGQTVEVVLGGQSADSVVVSGTVRTGGKPARDWQVSAVPFHGMEDGSADARCDENGAFRMVLAHPGWFTFSLRLPGRRTNRTETVQVPPAKSFEKDFDVSGTGRLAGRVIDRNGAAVSGVNVMAISDGRASGFGGHGFSGGETTDEHGAFAFDGLPASTYTLEARNGSPFGNDVGHASLEGIRLGDAESIAGLLLTMQECCSLDVTLRRADGKVVPPASVRAAGQETIRMVHSGTSSPTSGRGPYTLEGLQPGEVTVTATTQDPPLAGSSTVVLAPGEKGRVEIVLQSATTLVVRLDSPGRDPRDVFVVVRDQREATMRGEGWVGPAGTEDSEGDPSERRFGPCPAGHYTILAKHPDGASASAEVDVTGGEQQTVSLRLEP